MHGRHDLALAHDFFDGTVEFEAAFGCTDDAGHSGGFGWFGGGHGVVDWVVGWGCDFDHWICIVVDIIQATLVQTLWSFLVLINIDEMSSNVCAY